MKEARLPAGQLSTGRDRRTRIKTPLRQGTLTKTQLAALRLALSSVPFAKLLGIELTAAEVGSATLRLKIRRHHKQIQGVMHGGAIASLIDTATAFAIVTLLARGELFTTVDLTVNYLRPLTEGAATATSRVLRAGRRLITVSADVLDDSGNLAATALSTYLRLSSGPPGHSFLT